MKNIYSIYDEKAKVFLVPFFTENDLTAARLLTSAAVDKNSFLGQYPKDYKVYKIGQFDEETGYILPADKPDYCFAIVDLVPPEVVPSVDSRGGKK